MLCGMIPDGEVGCITSRRPLTTAYVPVCSTSRLKSACSMYILQNSAVAASAGAALVLFYTGILHGVRFWLLVRRILGS